MCEYSILPHVILEIDAQTGITEEIYRSGLSKTEIPEETSFRGGTPPIIVNYNGQIFYLSIGHIRVRKLLIISISFILLRLDLPSP